MDRSQIHPGLAKARAADVAKIPLAALKTMTPGQVPLRLLTYDVFVQKSSRPGLAPDLAGGYRQLAVEALTTEDPARAVELMKTAGVAPNYSPPELQQILRAGNAVRLSNGHICAVANVRDLRYFVTVAQGAIDRKTPEDSAELRNLLVSRARFLGVPQLIPANWGRPVTPSAKSAQLAKGTTGKYPAVDVLVAKASAARSVATALIAMADEGRLGELERDIGRMRQDINSGVSLVRGGRVV